MRTEPYNPNKKSHQEPIYPISEWQEFNDYADSERALKLAEYENRLEEEVDKVENPVIVRK